MLKSVGYAYPTSTYATKFGFAKVGCWIVFTHKVVESVGKPIAAYATQEEADAHASRLPADWCPLRNPGKAA
jgi:hypothetical protein